MKPHVLIVTLVLVVSLAGCSRIANSRLNPFNWWGQEETEAPVRVVVVEERRPLVAEITELAVERTPGGAIVRATGLPPTQGWFAAELVRETPQDASTIVYSFRAVPPREPERVSTARSRELTVAVHLTDLDLAGIRVIRVTGARNARSVRR